MGCSLKFLAGQRQQQASNIPRIIIFYIFFIVTILLLPVNGFITEQNDFVILRTRDSGTFVGIKEKVEKNVNVTLTNNPIVYYAFRGIPYAKPPIGQLRWKDPEFPDVTAGPKDSTKFKSACPQWDTVTGDVIGNPDCLYLNIFTPRLHFTINRSPNENSSSPYDDDPRYTTRLLPTLIYIHGGDFKYGSGNIKNYQRFLESNTLLVSFNYRIGVFGFLSSGNSTIPGNFGILDQILALKWIRKNIHRFGGDPNRITIFGQVTSLLLSPMAVSENIYQQAILMESQTSIFTPGFLVKNPMDFYTSFVNHIQCPNIGIEEVMDCLYLKSTDEIIEAQEKIIQNEYYFGLGPIFDSFSNRYENLTSIFPIQPEVEIKSDEFLERKIPILFGVNAAEGFQLLRKFYMTHHLINTTVQFEISRMKNHLLYFLKPIISSISSEAIDKIWEFYFSNFSSFIQPDVNTSEKLHLELLNMLGDIGVYNANWELMQVLAEKKSIVYNYAFEYNIDKIWPYLIGEEVGLDEYGSFPWEEEFHLFSSVQGTNFHHQVEDTMGDILVKIWTSFAAYRTPKSALAKRNTWGKWNRLAIEDGQTNYYHITAQGSNMKEDYRRKEAEFWKEVMEELRISQEATENSDRNLQITEDKTINKFDLDDKLGKHDKSLESDTKKTPSDNSAKESSNGNLIRFDYVSFIILLPLFLTLQFTMRQSLK